MVNRCERNIEKLKALADAALTAEQASVATAHVEQCVECRGYLEQLKGIADAAAPVQQAPDEAQWRGVWDQMAKRLPQRRVASRRVVFAWRLAFSAAAAALVAVVIFALMPGDGKVVAATADVVESIEAGAGYTTMQFVDEDGCALIVVMEESFKQEIPATADEEPSSGPL